MNLTAVAFVAGACFGVLGGSWLTWQLWPLAMMPRVKAGVNPGGRS